MPAATLDFRSKGFFKTSWDIYQDSQLTGSIAIHRVRWFPLEWAADVVLSEAKGQISSESAFRPSTFSLAMDGVVLASATLTTGRRIDGLTITAGAANYFLKVGNTLGTHFDVKDGSGTKIVTVPRMFIGSGARVTLDSVQID